LKDALLPRLPLARAPKASQWPIDIPGNVTLKLPSPVAVTVFVRVCFAETVTATRSLGRKPVPRTVTGESDGKVMCAARVEASAAGSPTKKSESTSANFTRSACPFDGLPTRR
jgi:hypothetical protein